MIEPDLTTEIIGYRQWYVGRNLELRAAGRRGQTWVPGANEAVCGRFRRPDFTARPASYEKSKPHPCGDTPGSDCECGFYALHDPSDFWYGKPKRDALASQVAKMTADPDPLVSGIIVAWGKVEVHHKGFRAQHARVAALATPQGKRDAAVIRAAAAEYGAACVPVEELPKIAAEFGATVPVDMRPEKPKPRDIESDYMRHMQRMLDQQKRMLYQQSQHWTSATSAFTEFGSTYSKPTRRKPWWHLGGF